MTYRYDVTSTSAVTFIWAFQKTSSVSDATSSSSMRDDVARIYSVEVTNPVSGAAGQCKLCPQGASQDGYDSSSSTVFSLPRWPHGSVIFVLTYFLVLVAVAVFEIFFSFSFVLVFIIFSF